MKIVEKMSNMLHWIKSGLSRVSANAMGSRDDHSGYCGELVSNAREFLNESGMSGFRY